MDLNFTQDQADAKEEEKMSGTFVPSEESKENTDFSSFNQDDESPLGFLSNKITSLVIGIVVIALVIPFLIFTLSKSSKSKTQSPKPTPVQVAKNITPLGGGKTSKVTPTPVKKQKQTAVTTTAQTTTKGGLPVGGASTTSMVGSKKYTDSTFGYSVAIPSNWETFKRAGTPNAYQIAIHPQGSSDVPFTIGAQSGTTETDWINTVYGTNYPRTSVQIAGRPALQISTPSYISYYTHDSSHVYEISEALGKPEYQPVYQSLLASLSFSK